MNILDKISNIPEDLRQYGLFCVWAYQDRPGSTKRAKVPYSPRTGQRARVDHPEDFAPFNTALAAFQTGAYSGIGILIDKNLCAIDIDNCIDTTGQLSPLAMDIVQQMQTYTEVSPSGRGLRLLFSITEPIDRGIYYVNNQTYHVEVYTSGTNKYVSLTGNVLIPAQRLEGRSSQLKIVLEKYMRRPTPLSKSVPVLPSAGSDIALSTIPPVSSFSQLEQLAQIVIAKASRAKNGPIFAALMAGDVSLHQGDRSAADLALCNILAFWTGKDPILMDCIFRKSGLYREKWIRPTGGRTYGELTIQRAIEGTHTVYSGKLISSENVEAEWAEMPADDEGAPVEEAIQNLCDYNIAFFPTKPGYYYTHEIGGTHYDVRSSFTDDGKKLERILENIIVERSAKGHR